MPEAPEVEVVVRAIRPLLEGARIDRSLSLHWWFRAPPTQNVASVHRHGKWIMVYDGHVVTQLHLGMSGSFQVGGPLHRHARWIAIVARDDDRRLLQFVDPRCMGRVRVLDHATSTAAMRFDATSRGCPAIGLGPDAMSASLARAQSCTVRARWRTMLDVPGELKPALLAQHVVAGLGNIYAAEACWMARADPHRPARDLARGQVHRLADAVPRMLRRSVHLGGTSIGDANTFRGDGGREGRMFAELHVYGREGLPCHRCGAPIRRDRQKGRSTFWCARCQT